MPVDSSSLSALERGFFAILGIVVGFCLNELRNYWSRNRTHSAYWIALGTEIEFARGRAQMYVEDGVKAPLYRLPTDAFSSCFPELLSDGVLTEADVTALMAFYSEVNTFNRGLERASEADTDAEIHSEYSRNLLKARQLIAIGPLYQAAIASVKASSSRLWRLWRYRT